MQISAMKRNSVPGPDPPGSGNIWPHRQCFGSGFIESVSRKFGESGCGSGCGSGTGSRSLKAVKK